MVPLRTPAGPAPPRPLLPLAWALVAGSGVGWTGEPTWALALVAAGLDPWWRARPGVRGGWVLAVALLAALRAALALPTGEGAVGRWTPRPGTVPAARRVLGTLADGRPPLAVPKGLVRAGEVLARRGPGREVLWARGPGSAPSTARVAHEADELRRLAPRPRSWAGDPGPPLGAARRALRRRLEELRDPPARGLAVALILGDRGLLEHDLADRFTRTGTRHVLALSGLHVGLAAALVAWPLGSALAALLAALTRGRWRPSPAWPRAALVLAIAPLGGASAPVARAALTLALAALAPRRRAGRGPAGRGVDALSLWSLALVLELGARPAAVAEVGVQLSYAATLGLVVGLGGLRRALRGLLPAQGHLAPVDRLGRPRSALWRVPLQRLLDGAVTAVAASVAASLATGPLVWGTFGEWAPAGLLVTPLALPAVAALLFGGWLWLALPGLAPAALVALPARGLLALLELADRLPGTPLVLPPRPTLWVATACALGLAAAAGRLPRLAPRGAALLGGVALVPWVLAPTGLEVHALAVGHGTAVLVRAPGGTWVFDAGSRDRPGVATRAVAPLLRRWEVGRVGFVLSHADRDHGGSLPWLLERWPAAVLAGADAARPPERRAHSRRPLDLERGRIALPGYGPLGATLVRGLPLRGNEGSRGLELRWGSERLLLLGDAEGPGLAATLEDGALEGPVELLLLPHHGSETPLLGPLLQTTRPRRVWVSGSDRPAVAPELDRRGLPWAATGRDGPLLWRSRGAPRATSGRPQ